MILSFPIALPRKGTQVYHSDNVSVSLTIADQVQYFFAHQPLVLSIVLAYALLSMIVYWFTSGRGFLISMVSSFFYLIPMMLHLARA